MTKSEKCILAREGASKSSFPGSRFHDNFQFTDACCRNLNFVHSIEGTIRIVLNFWTHLTSVCDTKMTINLTSCCDAFFHQLSKSKRNLVKALRTHLGEGGNSDVRSSDCHNRQMPGNEYPMVLIAPGPNIWHMTRVLLMDPGSWSRILSPGSKLCQNLENPGSLTRSQILFPFSTPTKSTTERFSN